MSAANLSPSERINAACLRMSDCKPEAQREGFHYLGGVMISLARERRVEAEEIAAAFERAVAHAEKASQ
jgi:hypothetical protein